MRGPGNDDWRVTNPGAADGDWHHVVATYDGSRGNINNTGSMLVFGARDGSGDAANPPAMENFSRMMIDDIYIYDRGLTPDEVAMLYGPDGIGPIAVLPAFDMSTQNIAVVADSAIDARSNADGKLGGLSFNADGVVTLTGSATDLSFTSVSVGAGVVGGINAEMPTAGGPLTVADGHRHDDSRRGPIGHDPGRRDDRTGPDHRPEPAAGDDHQDRFERGGG